jgi:hypothetical protein
MMTLIRRILVALGLMKPSKAPPPTVQGGGPGDTPPPPK